VYLLRYAQHDGFGVWKKSSLSFEHYLFVFNIGIVAPGERIFWFVRRARQIYIPFS